MRRNENFYILRPVQRSEPTLNLCSNALQVRYIRACKDQLPQGMFSIVRFLKRMGMDVDVSMNSRRSNSTSR